MLEPQPKYLNYTEYSRRPIWHAGIVFNPADLDTVRKTLIESARNFDYRYSGCFVDLGNQILFQYTNNRGRPNQPIRLPENCELAHKQLKKMLEERKITYTAFSTDQPWDDPVKPGSDFKILMGLQEGYGEKPTVHNLKEVEDLLGDTFHIAKATIFAVEHKENSDNEVSLYEEPAALIYCNTLDKLVELYYVGHQFRQSVLVVEELKKGAAYSVEYYYD